MRAAMPPPRYETQAALDNLQRLLHLWGDGGEPEQDWWLILDDPKRLSEFCGLYESGSLDADTKFALMMLIIPSLDSALRDETIRPDADLTARVERLLRQEFVLHLHTIYYWALLHEADPENVFPVTPLLRSIWADCFEREYQMNERKRELVEKIRSGHGTVEEEADWLSQLKGIDPYFYDSDEMLNLSDGVEARREFEKLRAQMEETLSTNQAPTES